MTRTIEIRWPLAVLAFSLVLACIGFAGAVWGLTAIVQILLMIFLPCLLLAALFRNPPGRYWVVLGLGLLPPVLLWAVLLPQTADSPTEVVLGGSFWGLEALAFLLLVTLPARPTDQARRLKRLRPSVAIAFLWILTLMGLSFLMTSRYGGHSSRLECRKLEAKLDYDSSSQNFNGLQQVRLVVPWEDESELKWSPSGRLLPLDQQPALLEDLDREGFRRWSGNSVGAWPSHRNLSRRYDLEVELQYGG